MRQARIPSKPSPHRHLLEVAALFTRLGATAFGGPAAHIAMQPAHSAPAQLALAWLAARWCQCRLAGINGRGDMATGPRLSHRPAHGCTGADLSGAALSLQGQLYLAGAERGRRRMGERGHSVKEIELPGNLEGGTTRGRQGYRADLDLPLVAIVWYTYAILKMDRQP